MSPLFASRTQVVLKSRHRALALEALEPRTLLSAVSWTGAGDGKSWTNPSNWSGNAVPGSNDNVTISLGGTPTIQITSGNQAVLSLTSTDPLSISGGTLSINASSTIGGGLTMTGGGLYAYGAGTSVSVAGATSVSGASLYAQNGATLTLPNLTSYVGNNSTLEANNANSVLNVSALASITSQGGWNITAINGGKINLSALTSLTANPSISLTDTGGATLLDPNLTTLSGVSATIDGTDAQVANSWTKFVSGGLFVSGGTYSLTKLTDVDLSNLNVQHGGSLSLPGVTTFATNENTFEASGTGSLLNVSSLTSVTYNASWGIETLSGGTVNLSGITAFGNSQRAVGITDTGGSTLLDPNVTTLTNAGVTLDGTDTQVANSWTKFLSGNLGITGGAYSLPSLTDVDGATLNVMNGGSLSLPNLKSYAAASSSFTAQGTGSILNVSALTNVTGGGWGITVINGGKMNLSGMTAITVPSGITDT
ncbi:MAG: hypothetical protein P4L84_20570, partial [Isosphaeraceae bacterium]|nr:hypothetical protein [Isosphaeraceae bacterium]